MTQSTIIKPHSHWLDLRLGELLRYRDLVLLLVHRDIVAKYKQTILGPLWYLIQPLLTTVVFTIVFGRIGRIPTDGLPPFLFYMAGNIVWMYFSECLTKIQTTFTANSAVFGKVYFPRLAIPVSTLVSSFLTFAIQLCLFLCFLAYFTWGRGDIGPNHTVVWLPILMLMIASLAMGIGLIISGLTARYRDLTHLVTFGVTLAMYATPVVYPLSAVPEKYAWLIRANPMSAPIEAIRYSFLGRGTVDSAALTQSAVVTIVILLLGILVFHRVERTFMDTI